MFTRDNKLYKYNKKCELITSCAISLPHRASGLDIDGDYNKVVRIRHDVCIYSKHRQLLASLSSSHTHTRISLGCMYN